jgi:hypothetical protein
MGFLRLEESTMVIFKTQQDLSKLDISDPSYAVIKNNLHRMSDLYPDHGYLILIEEGDTDKILDLPEVKRRMADIRWEGVVKQDGFYYAVYLTNNEFALEFLIPDSDWVSDELRKVLEENAVN